MRVPPNFNLGQRLATMRRARIIAMAMVRRVVLPPAILAPPTDPRFVPNLDQQQQLQLPRHLPRGDEQQRQRPLPRLKLKLGRGHSRGNADSALRLQRLRLLQHSQQPNFNFRLSASDRLSGFSARLESTIPRLFPKLKPGRRTVDAEFSPSSCLSSATGVYCGRRH